MWKLVRASDGTLFRDGYDDQWTSTISSYKSDDSRFKKDEALELESGSVVYMMEYMKFHRKDSIINEDGSFSAR